MKSATLQATRSQALLPLLLLALLSLVAGAGIAAEDPRIVVSFGPEDPIQLRDSGEVVIEKEETYVRPSKEGYPVWVSFAFASLDHYEAAASMGPQKFDLNELEVVILRSEDGETLELIDGQGLSPFELADQPRGNVCGDIFARAAVELAPDIWVGINLHAGPVRGGIAVLGIRMETPDLRNDCDFFSFGGCGGPTCQIGVFEFPPPRAYVRQGRCTVSPIPAFCWCL